MKRMQRMQSRKSHSWWWDSHISPKNSKWLAENLEEMDKQVKEMLKLIEEEGDSFAKKAEMYYQRRPLLVSHVENFYRMYRALAERYDNVTGELRKNIPSSLQSQGSYGISESDSETRSPSPSPEPDLEQKTPQQKQKPRPAGFDVFLGSGGSSDMSKKGSDGSSSSSDTDSELDEAKEDNGNATSYALNQRILELEDELHEAKEKLEVLEEKNMRCQCDFGVSGNTSSLNSKISELEEELTSTREKLQASEAEISNLQKDLKEKTRSSENFAEVNGQKEALEAAVLAKKNEIEGLKGAMASAAKQYESQLAYRDLEIEKCKQELGQASEKHLQDKSALEVEIGKLQEVIKNFEGDLAKISQEKLHLESRVKELEQAAHSLDGSAAEVMKLQEIIKNMQAELEKISHEKRVLEDRVVEFEQVSNELKASSIEVSKLQETVKNLKAELEGVSQEKLLLEGRVQDLEQVACDLKASAASSSEKFSLEKSFLSGELLKLSEANASLESRLASMNSQLQQLNAEKEAASLESEKHISELNQNLASLNTMLELLAAKKAAADNQVASLLTDIAARDKKIKQMDGHLNQLHMEHVKLIAGTDAARKAMMELRARVHELEEEVEKQKIVISDSAEGKREAIRQLCFSLQHYRDGYQQLRQLLQGHKRPMVMAT